LREQRTILQNIDWLMVGIYLVLVIIGWMNIFASSYSADNPKIFDFTKNYGKQIIWIGTALVIAMAILIIDGKFYAAFSYPFYLLMLLLMIVVLFISKDVKGAHAWVDIGSFKLQPSEFAKFATNMALAKYLSTLDTKMQDLRTKVISAAIILVPLAIILKQNDTGSALVYFSFVFVLYREGLSGNFLLYGLLTMVLVILTLLVDNKFYLVIAIVTVCTILFLTTRRTIRNLVPIVAGLIVAVVIVFSVNYVFNKVLHDYQRQRINILFGKEIDIKKAGYNVNQSKIAIGSGGFTGKGFMQGTLTKGEFIPEQSTDFIFCTVGEEWGFLGTFFVITLFTVLLMRIIYVAERQRSTYSRIYGYGVACILFFHLVINVGMTIGLVPVIGIPFPFFSYGGSSLWSFTILLFIFIKLDAYRMQILR
jgi:rod shape determining protein RodA